MGSRHNLTPVCSQRQQCFGGRVAVGIQATRMALRRAWRFPHIKHRAEFGSTGVDWQSWQSTM